MTEVTAVPPVLRDVSMQTWGWVGCQLEDTRLTWQERVDDLRAPLCAQADALDHAFIRRSRYWGAAWQNLAISVYPLADAAIGEYEIGNSRALLDRFVLDVHGVQVLTRAHLDNAASLDDWVVRELAPDRYLVESTDLAAWYAQDLPDPEALTAARSDFADMLITPAVLTQHG